MYLYSWVAVVELSGVGFSFLAIGFAYGAVQKSVSTLLFRTTGD
jgi:DNA replication protein DnaC